MDGLDDRAGHRDGGGRPAPAGQGQGDHDGPHHGPGGIQRVRTGHFIARGPASGRLWFAATGIVNGVGTLMLYAAVGAGPVTLVAPIVATYPLMTVAMSALVLAHVKITPRLVLGTAMAVAGVVLILVG